MTPANTSLAKAWLAIAVATVGAAIIQKIFVAQELAAAVGGAILARVVADRAGVGTASADRETTAVARSIGVGVFAIGLALLGAAIIAIATGLATLHAGEFSPIGASLALVRSVALASRDEVAFRLLPIELFARLGSKRTGVAIAIALGFFSADPIAAPVASLLALAIGALGAVLYLRDDDIYGPIAANATLRFVTGTLLVSMIELRLKSGTLLPFEHAKGPVPIIASACVLAAALGLWKQGKTSSKATPSSPAHRAPPSDR